MQLRTRSYGETCGKVATRVPERLTHNSLQNLANRLREKQKVGSARRVTH